MNVGPLKISLGVSVLLHGLAIGGAIWLGQTHHVPAAVTVSGLPTLEFVAAPAETPEQTIDAPSASVQPAPVPPSPPPEEIVRPETIAAIPVETVPLPQPPLPVKQRPPTPPVIVIPVAVTPAAASAISAINAHSGDNSSPLSGKDSASVAGRPNALAKPDYLKNPEPEYPLVARRRSQQGTVLLNVTVSASGHPTEIFLKRSSGYELLDQAALQAVKRWVFEPARIGAMAVESKIEVPVRFKLTH